mmetsp:Transcript_24307/g.57581  ORF Transcript_24307/g.57581 Transcript_24307/m.57581 type:complete len:201 (+) Transcript_24307:602-1204(+)
MQTALPALTRPPAEMATCGRSCRRHWLASNATWRSCESRRIRLQHWRRPVPRAAGCVPCAWPPTPRLRPRERSREALPGGNFRVGTFFTRTASFLGFGAASLARWAAAPCRRRRELAGRRCASPSPRMRGSSCRTTWWRVTSNCRRRRSAKPELRGCRHTFGSKDPACGRTTPFSMGQSSNGLQQREPSAQCLHLLPDTS